MEIRLITKVVSNLSIIVLTGDTYQKKYYPTE